MIVYLFLLLYIIIIWLIINREKLSKGSEYFFLNILFIIMLFMIVFRADSVGTDYLNHFKSFSYYKDFSLLPNDIVELIFSEPIWNSLFILANQFSSNFSIFWLLYFLILWICLIKSVPNNISRLFVCIMFVLSYYYYASYNTSAQILASCVILCALKMISQKKYIKSIILIMLALGIHKSTIFIIPFIIVLNYISIHKYIYYILFMASLVILLMKFDVLLFENLDTYAQTVDAMENMSDYNKYLTMDDNNLNLTGQIMHYSLLGINILLFIVLHYKKSIQLNVYSQFWAIGIVIYILTINYEWLFRLSYWFLIPMIIAIPKVIFELKKEKRKETLICNIALILLIFIYICKLYNNADGIVPYKMLDI